MQLFVWRETSEDNSCGVWCGFLVQLVQLMWCLMWFLVQSVQIMLCLVWADEQCIVAGAGGQMGEEEWVASCHTWHARNTGEIKSSESTIRGGWGVEMPIGRPRCYCCDTWATINTGRVSLQGVPNRGKSSHCAQHPEQSIYQYWGNIPGVFHNISRGTFPTIRKDVLIKIISFRLTLMFYFNINLQVQTDIT